MGVLKKLKDIFYDEEIIEEEETVEEKPKIREIMPTMEKKQEKQEDTLIKKQPTEEIRIPRFEEPKKVDPIENISKYEEEDTKTIPERELFQSKKTFNFPILDDEPERPKTRSNVNVMEVERKQKQERKIEENNEETVTGNFKPSPVISPVYGILDKNFKKEDIISRNKQIERSTRSSSSIAYDTVRKKAYGSLEDDLESTLSDNTRLEARKILDEVNNIEKELNELENDTHELRNTEGYRGSLIEDLHEREKVTIGEMEEHTKRIEIDNDVEDITREVKIEETSRIEKYKKDTEPEKKKISDVGDKTLEHDLFNLIDSMYDEEEE